MKGFGKSVGRSAVTFRYLFWALPFLLCHLVNGQPYTVWGQVDANNRSLANAQVQASRSGNQVVTDETGKFKLDVFSQDTLTFAHPDFPARRYVLPVLEGAIRFYFDVATDRGFWEPYKDEHRATVDPPTTDKPQTMPSFPWPVPAPSAKVVLDTRYFANVTTLAQADRRLADALQRSGYPNPSYYHIPNGFALVGQIEQIERDGTPKQSPARWSARVESPFGQFKLSNYLQLLFKAATGYFRIIVFLVTDVPAEKSQQSVSAETAKAWYSGGVDFLPADVGRQAFTSDYRVTALIYEFEKPENSKVRFLNPGNCPGQDHLTKAKITTYLTR